MRFLTTTLRRIGIASITGMALAAAPLSAQVETIDPNAAYQDSGAIDADLEESPGEPPVYAIPEDIGSPASTAPTPRPSVSDTFPADQDTVQEAPEWSDPGSTAAPVEAQAQAAAANPSPTYAEDDLIGAAEGVFGKGAEGVAKLIQDLLKDQGEPNGYIVGREAGGAFVVGARYGSGTLFHKIEGQMPVYWTGPSIGFDAGANAGNTFVLVYNLFDSEDLYKRFPAGEGQLYAIGGMHASYMRRGDIVLIPIRVGAGLRAGVNAGYMKFSKKQRWLPF